MNLSSNSSSLEAADTAVPDTADCRPKQLKLERAATATKISFDDTMDTGDRHRGSGVSEPDSSDEEEGERSRYRVEIVPALMEEAAPAPAPHDRRRARGPATV